jgi:superfamily I DNA/RNA helicase
MNIAELPPLNVQQRASATAAPDLPLLVIASAGTGKTTLIVARVKHLIDSGVEPWKILVLVFTKQAAKEAKERLKLYEIIGITVGTFHSFGMGIIKKQYRVLGFEQQPSVVFKDEEILPIIEECMLTVKINNLLENACQWLQIPLQGATWDTVADEIRSTLPDLYDKCWKEAFAPKKKDTSTATETATATSASVDAGSESSSEEEEEEDDPELRNPAKRARKGEDSSGAGGSSSPSPSDDSEEEDNEEEESDGEGDEDQMPIPQPGTRLASLKFKQRVEAIKAFYLGLIDSRDDFWLRPTAEKQFKFPVKPDPDAPREDDDLEAYAEYEKVLKWCNKTISNAKTRGHRPAQYHGGLQAVYELYELALKEKNLIDFNDMLLLVNDFLRTHPDALATLQERYQYLLVDEAQDLNPLQLSITLLMTPAGRLTCVGDNCQSIYRFRGSETWTMHCLEHMYQGLNPAMKQVLTVNYRSTQNILDVARVVLKEQGKDLVAANHDPHAAPVTILETGTEIDEAEWIRRQIQKHHAAGVPYKQMAILYRMRRGLADTTTRPIQAALDKEGIPNKLLSERSLLNRTVVKDIKAYLTLAINPHNDTAFLTVVNRPRRGFGDAAVGILKKYQEDHPVGMSLYRCVEHICAETTTIAAGRAKKFLSPAQEEGLKAFKILIDELHDGILTRDPAEFVYFVLKRTKYVLWAEVMSSRKYKMKDDANAMFDWDNVDLELLRRNRRIPSKKHRIRRGSRNGGDNENASGDDASGSESESDLDDFIAEVVEEDNAGGEVEEEESFDFSGSSSDEDESFDFSGSSSNDDDDDFDEAMFDGTVTAVEGGESSMRMARRRKREAEMMIGVEIEEGSDLGGEIVNSEEEEEEENNNEEEEDRAAPDNAHLFADPYDKDSDDDSSESEEENEADNHNFEEDSEEENEAGDEEEREYRKKDPLHRYRFNLSHFQATTAPLRRLLREAALFTDNFCLDFNEAEKIYKEEHIGPPSLMRIAWNTLSTSPAAAEFREQLHEKDELQVWASRLRIGPLIMMDFMHHVFESKEDEASTLDSNNVILSTIHRSKGLEFDIVFIPRCNRDVLPCYFNPEADDEQQPDPPEEPLIPNYQPPEVENIQAFQEEERRIAHVGMTRARHKLYLTLVRYQKAKFGSHRLENPSELITELVNYFIIDPFDSSKHITRQLPSGRRVDARKEVLEVIIVPRTERESGTVVKVWNPDNRKEYIRSHPHAIWADMERALEEQQADYI